MKRSCKRIVAITAAVAVLVCLVGAIGLYAYSAKQNQTIITTEYTVSHPQIPASFEGKRIVHLTDLHNADFGTRLTDLVKAQAPDAIMVTGDWITKDDTDITPAKRQMAELVAIAPVYYVTGNHEAWSPLCAELLIFLEEIGVVTLEQDAVDWVENGESIQIIGMYDPDFSRHLYRDFAPNVDAERFSLFLFHRPEYFEEAVSFGADLILSGHTHGGQIRLPFIGSLYAPNQGWFPTYDVGRFSCGESTMIVSQGLGVGTAVRILTPPEMVVVTLDSPQVG